MAAAADEKPDCSWHDEAVDGHTGQTSFRLLSTEPASGTQARRGTVLAFDIEYHIADFTPGTFFPAVLCRTLGQNAVSSHQFDKPYYFEHATGRARLCVPLEPLYGKAIVHWPLEGSIVLIQMAGSGSASVSDSIALSFQSPDAAARNPRRPPDEYYAALDRRASAALIEAAIAIDMDTLRKYPQPQVEAGTP